MKKTSATHPLQIAVVSAGPGLGRIGLTFCPGKYDPDAMTGYWERDLELDLDAICDWGAAAVVTLVEHKELAELRIERLGEAVTRRNLAWFHLPIIDASIPDKQFERQWEISGNELRSLLRSRRDVLIHCKGGLGRTGLVAALLLVELGMAPEVAIARVRAVRPGAIETHAQKRYVLSLLPRVE